jgi:hypothetical protein
VSDSTSELISASSYERSNPIADTTIAQSSVASIKSVTILDEQKTSESLSSSNFSNSAL